MLRVKSLWVYCKLPPLMLCGERGISSRLNNGTICSVFLFSFLLFRMIYFKCCFNKWVLLLLLHYSTQYTLLWETVGISWEKSFINSLNIEQNKRLMWATCNHIYQIFLQQKGPACTSSQNTSITCKEWHISSGSPNSPNEKIQEPLLCDTHKKNTELKFMINFGQ